MEQLIPRIRAKVEAILKEKIDYIEKFENVPNNSVYKISAAGKLYIFKIYKNRHWPENGKLMFVNQQLLENHIECARLIAFSRDDSHFPNGMLVEEYLSGVTADHMTFDLQSGKDFYRELALLVSEIHRIRLRNYGYIGNGIADYTSFLEFMDDKYDEIANSLIKKQLFDKNGLQEIKEPVMDKLRLCDGLPSVLNHGDLSTKNVIIGPTGKLALIDWDDAMAYNWMADVARMTYWMKFEYDDYEYEAYRNAFMENYSTDNRTSDIDDLENAFHVWIGLDHLNFHANTPQYANTMAYVNAAITKLE